MKKNTGMKSGSLSRRGFLKGVAAAAGGAAFGFPYVITTPVCGANAPSNKITFGCIGVGRMGSDDLKEIMGFDEAQIVAVCDVDSKRAKQAKQAVEGHYGSLSESGTYKGCAEYKDFRELLARKDIDAVTVVTPDHWHALAAIAAAKAGKDIFVQKPLTFTVEEGRALSDTARRYGRVVQVGSQQRSDAKFRFGCELVRNGRIGKVHTIKVGLPIDPSTELQPVMPVPENLDYDMWLGPAPLAPYTEKRTHPQKDYSRPGWMCISDYCHGIITNWGSHHLDIAQWGLGTEYTGPVEIEGHAEYPKEGLWDVHLTFHAEYTYANGVKMTCTTNTENKQGIVFEGTEGWVYVDRGSIDANPKSLLTSVIGPDEIHLYKSDNHKKNFLDCIRSRAETIAPPEVAHRSNSIGIITSIAMELGRKLKWDPQSERFVGDAEADRMLVRPMRSPWCL